MLSASNCTCTSSPCPYLVPGNSFRAAVQFFIVAFCRWPQRGSLWRVIASNKNPASQAGARSSRTKGATTDASNGRILLLWNNNNILYVIPQLQLTTRLQKNVPVVPFFVASKEGRYCDGCASSCWLLVVLVVTSFVAGESLWLEGLDVVVRSNF